MLPGRGLRWPAESGEGAGELAAALLNLGGIGVVGDRRTVDQDLDLDLDLDRLALRL
jgi:hypothetical protein